jgi:hypothetical protein
VTAAPANPWDIVRAIWPGCFAEPWQDEQIGAGRGDWPAVWVMSGVRDVRAEGPVSRWYHAPTVRRAEARKIELQPGGRWVDTGHSTLFDPTGDSAALNSEAIVRVRELGYRWWCRERPFVSFARIVDVRAGRSYRADHAALPGLVDSGAVPSGELWWAAKQIVRGERHRQERRAARGLTG